MSSQLAKQSWCHIYQHAQRWNGREALPPCWFCTNSAGSCTENARDVSLYVAHAYEDFPEKQKRRLLILLSLLMALTVFRRILTKLPQVNWQWGQAYGLIPSWQRMCLFIWLAWSLLKVQYKHSWCLIRSPCSRRCL